MLPSRPFKVLALLLLGGVLLACASHARVPMPTVANVDVDRYAGRWFEIAMLPNRFQAMCISDTEARYRVDGNTLRVRNRCRRDDGSIEEALGKAEIVENTGNARLRVSFFWPFYGDYWILALDDDYQWALVGEPSRTFGWILSRQPTLDEQTLNRLLDKAESLGYQRSTFVRTAQGNALPD